MCPGWIRHIQPSTVDKLHGQDSVLDPLLFLLYVNDVVKLFSFGLLCKNCMQISRNCTCKFCKETAKCLMGVFYRPPGVYIYLFHSLPRAAYLHNGCLVWYNVVITLRVRSSVKYSQQSLVRRWNNLFHRRTSDC